LSHLFTSFLTRTIPYKAKIGRPPNALDLPSIAGNANRAEDLLEFCKAPRARGEILEYFGLSPKCGVLLLYSYLNPLIEDGRLTMTNPEFQGSRLQKFITAEFAPKTLPTFEEVMKYCNEPRSYNEVEDYFGLTRSQAVKLAYALIRKNKLKTVKPSSADGGKKLLTAESGYFATQEEQLIEFCQTPKAPKEIAEFLGMSVFCSDAYIIPLVEKGVIKYDRPQKGKTRIGIKYVSANADWAVLSEESLIEFCKTPRTKTEIFKHFRVSNFWTNYINDLVDKGKLITKYPLELVSRNNCYVAPDTEAIILTEKAVMDFCRIPRRRREIEKHFGLLDYCQKEYIDNMVEKKLLKGDSPHKAMAYQKLISAEMQDTPKLSKEEIINFCQEPKSRSEILNHFNLTDIYWYLIEDYIDSGLLVTRVPNCIGRKVQKYVSHNSNAVILTADTLLEFCQTPRLRDEIKSHFNISEHQVSKYARVLQGMGRLKKEATYQRSGKVEAILYSTVADSK